MAAPGSTRHGAPRPESARGARASPSRSAGWRSARRPARRSRSCGSPASTGRAATRSTICAPARPGASTSPGRCSTASTSTTSAAPSRRRLRHEGAQRRLERHRRRAGAGARRRGLCGEAARHRRRRSCPFAEAELSPMARSFYGANRRVANDRLKHELGVSAGLPDLPRRPRGALGRRRGARKFSAEDAGKTALLIDGRRFDDTVGDPVPDRG